MAPASGGSSRAPRLRPRPVPLFQGARALRLSSSIKDSRSASRRPRPPPRPALSGSLRSDRRPRVPSPTHRPSRPGSRQVEVLRPIAGSPGRDATPLVIPVYCTLKASVAPLQR